MSVSNWGATLRNRIEQAVQARIVPRSSQVGRTEQTHPSHPWAARDMFSPAPTQRPLVDLSGGSGSMAPSGGTLSRGGSGSTGAPAMNAVALVDGASMPAAAQGTSGERYPVPYINQMNSDGWEDDWNALSNCGPTTLAMIAKGFGMGEGMSDGALVNELASSIGMGSEGVGYAGMQAMGEHLGLTSEANAGSDVEWIRQQLEAGNLVAANGDRSVTLENEQPPYASGTAGGGHWIAVTGMTPEGNFIVKDPSTTCRELTPDELSRFLAANEAHGGYSVAYHPPPGV
jgi:hypothetical protein